MVSSMSNPTERSPDNAPGPYYVDESCIDCDQCRVMAPELFGRNENTGLGYVKRQPVTEDEILLADEALAACGTNSIHKDGV